MSLLGILLWFSAVHVPTLRGEHLWLSCMSFSIFILSSSRTAVMLRNLGLPAIPLYGKMTQVQNSVLSIPISLSLSFR